MSKTQKRGRDEGGEAGGAKRRKVSQAVLDMRRGDDIDVVEVEEGGGGRNRVVARDRLKDDSLGGRSIFKTKPINIDTSPEKSGIKVTSWLSKKSSPARKKPAETAEFDLDLSAVEVMDDSPISHESISSKISSSGSLPDPEIKKSRTLSPKHIKMLTQKASKISSQEPSKTSSTVKASKLSPPKAPKLGSPKPAKTSSGKPPVYRRNRLLAFTQMALIKAGVLVQVCTLYTVHCTLYTGHWTLDTGHWTLDTGHCVTMSSSPYVYIKVGANTLKSSSTCQFPAKIMFS